MNTTTTTYTLPSREHFRASFDGSDALFSSCWRQYRAYLNGSIDDPTCDADVISWLDQIAADKVNDSKSSFYIYG